MALIRCRECGTEFSDLAPACPKCACPTEYMKETPPVIKKEEPVIKCSECGNILDSSDNVCKNCGCPVNLMNNNQVKEEVTIMNTNNDLNKEIPIKGKKNNKLIIAGIIFLIVFAMLFIFNLFGNNLKSKLVGRLFVQELTSSGITTKSSYRFKSDGLVTFKIDIDIPSYLRPTSVKDSDLHTTNEYSYVIESNNIVAIYGDSSTSRYEYDDSTKCLISTTNSKVRYCVK